MPLIYDYLIFTTKIEVDLEHDSKILPQFLIPQIYTAKGDFIQALVCLFFSQKSKKNKTRTNGKCKWSSKPLQN